MTGHLDCDDVRELAPELALGLLTGEQRADVLDHLEDCECCRAEVASLAGAADEVLLAAPAVEPPPGFRDRVLARVAAERRAGDDLPLVPGPTAERPAGRRGAGAGGRRARVRRRRLLAGAAAAGALVVGGALAVLLGLGRDDGGSGGAVAAAEMRSESGRDVGDVTATRDGGNDGTTVVTLAFPGWAEAVERWGDAPAGSYWLVVELDDGRQTRQPLTSEVDDWSMRVGAPVDELASVAMVGDDGRVWCSGTFAPV